MTKVLIIYHSQTGNTEKMAKAIAEGAKRVSGTKVIFKKAAEATLEDLIDSSGIAIGSPDYFGYMAGTVKDFFDRTFYPSQSKVTGKPAVLFASGGEGGKPALESLRRICGSFKFKQIGEIAVIGKPPSEEIAKCEKLGEKLANAVK